MKARLRVVGLIPARGGSKGVARKNLRLLGGRPLLSWTADAALSAESLDRVVLTTDDPEIAAAGRAQGLDVPFLRPAALAADDTPTLDVVRHALWWLEQSDDRFDALVLLQPTSPFRAPGIIDQAVKILQERNATSVISVRPVPHRYNPHWVFQPDRDGVLRLASGEREPLPRRQLLPEAYIRDGRLYAVRTEVVLEQGSLYGDRCLPLYQCDLEDINLDTLEDFATAERLLARSNGQA